MTNARTKSRAKGSTDNRYKKNPVIKHQMTREPLDLLMKKETPTEPQVHAEPPREVDTSQVTYADIVKATPASPPNEAGLTSTQV